MPLPCTGRGRPVVSFAAAIILTIVLSSTAHVAAQRRRRADSPNIVLLLADDISANEFSFLTQSGSPSLSRARTPNIKKMRNNGVSFLTAWSMAVCGPTRGSLVTGLYAQVTGWINNQKPDGSLGTKFGTFAQLAQKQGYKTMIAGKWQMEGDVPSYGYDEACLWATSDDPEIKLRSLLGNYSGPFNPTTGPQGGQPSRYWHPLIVSGGKIIPSGPLDYGPNIIFDCAKNFITRQTKLGNKFMLYMPTLLTHSDYDFDIDDKRRSNRFIPVPRLNRAGKILGKEPGEGSLKRNIEYHDFLVGQLLEHIEAEGQKQKTITFYVGDNGSQEYGKKQLTNEVANRVPFVVYGPGRVRVARNSKEFASTNDIYATFASLMGAKIPADRPRPNSVDLSPYLLGKENRVRRQWLYSLLDDNRWVRGKFGMVDGEGKYWRCLNSDERSCRQISPSTSLTDQIFYDEYLKIICLLEKQKPVDEDSMTQRGSC